MELLFPSFSFCLLKRKRSQEKGKLKNQKPKKHLLAKQLIKRLKRKRKRKANLNSQRWIKRKRRNEMICKDNAFALVPFWSLDQTPLPTVWQGGFFIQYHWRVQEW